MKNSQLYNRRLFVSSALASPFILPSIAHSNPLLGLFARLTFSQYAKSAAARVLATSAAGAIVKPLTKSAVSAVGKSRIGATKKQMAAVGGFGTLVNEFSGRLAGDIAADFGKYGGTNEFSAVHAENSIVSGAYGKPQCLGIISSKDLSEKPIMLESPEIVALERMQDRALKYGFEPKETAKMLLPMKMIDNGNFTYRYGHDRPAVFETTEGNVSLTSDANGSTGRVFGEFTPRRNSRYQKFSAEQILG